MKIDSNTKVNLESLKEEKDRLKKELETQKLLITDTFQAVTHPLNASPQRFLLKNLTSGIALVEGAFIMYKFTRKMRRFFFRR